MELAVIKKDLNEVKEAVLNGDLDALEVYSDASRILKEFKKLSEAIKGHAKDEASKFHKQELLDKGVELRTGGALLCYDEDPIYSELKSELKKRESLLKEAQKNTVYDSEGIEVPRVTVKYKADSIIIK